MTEDEAFHTNSNYPLQFFTYYGQELVGFLVDIDEDPFYYIVHDKQGWKKANHSRDENILKTVGKKIHRSAVSSPVMYQHNQDRNHGGWSQDSFNRNMHSKKMVICGAGASYDYDFEDDDKKGDWVPPLGNGLFDKRFSKIIEQFPGVRSSLTELRLAPDIEEFFQKEWTEVIEDYRPERLMDLINIQYYLQYLIAEVSKQNNNYESNNYDALIRGAYRYTRRPNHKAIIVTFNYDTLIEQSMERVHHFKFSSINDYVINPSDLCLIKPHGSCNWCWPLKKSSTGIIGKDESTLQTAQYFFEQKYNLADINFKFRINGGDIKMIDEKEDGSNYFIINDTKSIYPALLIPYHTKDEFVLPKRHNDHLEFYLPQVEDILIIGWKGRESYFMNLLEDKVLKNINLTVVDINHESVRAEVEKVITISAYKSYSTFTEYVKTGGVSEFWNS